MPAAGPTVVLAGRLVDTLEAEVRSDVALLLDEDRVRDVMPAPDAPRTGTVVDLSSKTVLPGMIDSHAHLIGEMDGGQGYGFLAERTSAQEALTGVPNARATLHAGFTTVRDIGTFHAFVDLALRDAIDAGMILGPRMQCAGAYVTCPGGGGDRTGLPPGTPIPPELQVGVSTGPDEVRRNVRRIFDAGADFIPLKPRLLAMIRSITSSAPPPIDSRRLSRK